MYHKISLVYIRFMQLYIMFKNEILTVVFLAFSLFFFSWESFLQTVKRKMIIKRENNNRKKLFENQEETFFVCQAYKLLEMSNKQFFTMFVIPLYNISIFYLNNILIKFFQ